MDNLRTLAEYETIATGRHTSLFVDDLLKHQSEISDRLYGRQVAIIGAAGSIGYSTVRAILGFTPKTVALFDLNENGLVEVIRELRSSPGIRPPENLAALPIGLGSLEFTRYLREHKPFDYILNLSALKHVRSQKDVYTLMRMVDTNILFLHELVHNLPRPCINFFSVSSDKAVNPGNLMGATKMVMEKVLLSHSAIQPYSSARFANVAFSNGSLPFGVLQRLQKRQPLAAPADVRRYFISHEEAGQLCLLASILGENGDIFFPKLRGLSEKTFPEIAIAILNLTGYEPFECRSEEEAKNSIDELLAQGKWPCLFTASDTEGEKPLEEFYADGDRLDIDRFGRIGIVKKKLQSNERTATENFIRFARTAKSKRDISKDDYIAELQHLVPSLQHVDSDRSLDEKM